MTDQNSSTTFGVAIEIIAFVMIVFADALGYVPLTQTLFLVPLIWFLLWLRGEGWSKIGLTRPDNLLKAIGLGVIAGIAMEFFAVYVTTPQISALFGQSPDYSDLSDIRGDLVLLGIFLALNWTLAAFGEEICFRGFLMKRLAQLFGEGKWAWMASLLCSSLLFGWGHTEQGIAGWVQEGLSALLLGTMFLASKKNLTIPIVAHGVSNTVAFVLIYLGRYPGLDT